MTRVDFGQSIDGVGNREPDVIAAFTITTGLALIAVILRFVSRRLARAKLWYDDWLMLVGLLLSLGFAAAISYWTSVGLGKYIGLVTPETLAQSYKVIFACEMLYLFAIGIVKAAVIAFYWRILAHSRQLRIALYVFSAVNIGWVVALFFTVLFQCTPIPAFWQKDIDPQTCGVDFKTLLISNMIPNFITDVALVLLPIFYIPPRVNTNTLQRIVLYIIFSLGFFVTVAPIIRLILVAKMDPLTRNMTWDFVDYVIWTGVEINVAIVAGCLPSLKPVLAKLVPEAFIPKKLRESGRKRWIVASPDQTWLQEPVSISTDPNSRSNSESRQGGPDMFQHHRSASQEQLVNNNSEVAMSDLSPQRSNISMGSSFKHQPAMAV